MLDIQTSLLGLTTAVNAGLFAFVFLGNRHSPVNQSFAAFVCCLAVWAALHIGFRTVASDATALSLLNISYVCALLIAASFYYFSIVFPEGKRPGRLHTIALASAVVIFGISLLVPGVLTTNVIAEPYGRAVTLTTPAYAAFVLIFGVLFIGGQARIWRKFATARAKLRIQLLAIGLTVTTVGIVGIYFDLLLPSPFFENFRYVWTGPVLTTVFAISITYSIFRYRLFNLHAAATELLVFAWWLLVLIRALSANASLNLVADQTLLLISAPIGMLLLRSVKANDLGDA